MKTWDLDSLTKKGRNGVALLDDYNKLSFAEVANILNGSVVGQEFKDTIIYLFRRLAEALPEKEKEHG